MTKEELAAKLNGRKYGDEITKEETAAAKAAGLVVVFGYSDDNAEFRGAIHDEIPCYNGGEILIVDGRIWGSGKGSCDAGDADCECPHHARALADAKARGKTIMAVWGERGCPDCPDWTYVTQIPHVPAIDALVAEARRGRRGLWSDPRPVEPRLWRKGQR